MLNVSKERKGFGRKTIPVTKRVYIKRTQLRAYVKIYRRTTMSDTLLYERTHRSAENAVKMDAPHHVLVGAETGLLKGLNVTKSKWENLNSLTEVDRSNEICVMCWENQSAEDSVLFGTRGGLVKTYCRQTQAVEKILQVTDDGDQVLKGLYKLDCRYVTCTNKGRLCVWTEDRQSNEESTPPVSIDCGANIYSMKEDPSLPHRAATGGKENCLKLYDLNRPDTHQIFKAKNVRDDWLDLRVPIWVTDIGYMPKASSSLIVTTTGHHQIRVYDPSTTQRRPMIEMEWEQYPITALCVNPHNDRQLLVGNTVGEQAMLDVRNKKCLGKYKGGAGAIRSLQCHPTLPVVVSCGLDRYVRIHDMKSRVLTQKFYLKSRLNKLLLVTDWSDDEIKEEIKEEPVTAELLDDEVEESDALWEGLDTVDDEAKTVKKTHKRSAKTVTKVPLKKGKKKKRNAEA